MRTTKTLIRLGGCPGWSESSLGAHSFCWFCHVVAQICQESAFISVPKRTTWYGYYCQLIVQRVLTGREVWVINVISWERATYFNYFCSGAVYVIISSHGCTQRQLKVTSNSRTLNKRAYFLLFLKRELPSLQPSFLWRRVLCIGTTECGVRHTLIINAWYTRS